MSEGEELPEGWANVPLGEVVEPGGIFDGPFGSSLKTDDYTASGVRVIRLENLANLRFVVEKETFISEAKYRTLSKHTVVKNDLLVGSFVDGPVRVCVLPELATKAIAKADCFCVRTDIRILDRRFTALALGRTATKDALVEEIHGATRPRITTKQLRGLPVCVPPLPEQHRIVEQVEALLDQVNKAKDRLDGVKVILKRFRQAVLAAACSGKLTEEWREKNPYPALDLPTADAPDIDLPESWRCAGTHSLCDPARPITYGVIKLGQPVEAGVPTLRSSDVRPLYIDRSGIKRISREIAAQYSRTFLKGGEVLVTVRGTLGGIAVVPPDMTGYNISREVAVLPFLQAFNPYFLAFAIAGKTSQNWLGERAKGAAYTGINIEDLRLLPLPVPPVEEQAEIVRIVQKMFSLADSIEARLTTASTRAEKLPQSILSKAFRGELVPTEAELARAEGREYEPAAVLLERIRVDREANGAAKKRKGRSSSASQPRPTHGAPGRPNKSKAR